MASTEAKDIFNLQYPNGWQQEMNSLNLSWSEIQKTVRNARLTNITLANASRVPCHFSFRTVTRGNDKVIRAYFLCVPPNTTTRDNTLLYVDLPCYSDTPQINTPFSNGSSMQWNRLLNIQDAYLHCMPFSKEEQLLRERKRLGSFGITSYDMELSTGTFVFSSSGTLFSCVDSLAKQHCCPNYVPYELSKGTCPGTRIDGKICPCNSSLVAFVADRDIWVVHSQSGHNQRLTYLQDAQKDGESGLSAGVPPFVIQEEFDRYTGYWWQSTPTDGRYRILYEFLDENAVRMVNLVCPSSNGLDIEKHRYPRAGEANAVSVLRLVEFTVDEFGQVRDVVHKELMDPNNVTSLEYLVRAGWYRDGTSVWAQVVNRNQDRLDTLLIPLSSFTPISDNSGKENSVQDKSEAMSLTTYRCSANFTAIHTQMSDIWVNVADILHFLPSKDETSVRFIISSEKTKFRHVYYVQASLVRDEFGNHQEAVIETEVQLTSGNWEVIGKDIWVDEGRQLFFFTGYRDTPLESHLYVASYGCPQEVVRLTQPGYSHTIYMDKVREKSESIRIKDCRVFVDVYSRIDRPPGCDIYAITHAQSDCSVHKITTLLQPANLDALDTFSPPSLFSYEASSGHMMHGMLFHPRDFRSGVKYPTVLYVYGGPQVQVVSNSFKGMRLSRQHMMARLGFLVMAIDSRGSCCRGLEFEAWIKNRMGAVEIADQVEGLHWLAEKTQAIDLQRVAIHGSSYGGYLALKGLQQRPDIFKISIAMCPVTSWELYDTAYTERYMGRPQDNPRGYTEGSVLSTVSGFPDQPGRLLIVHGLMDENVHFFHTSSLIDALVKAGKPYQLQVYPNERHGIRSVDANEHYETLVLHMLLQNL